MMIDLAFDGFDGSVDRLFAADGNRVYWQAGNQLRGGVIVDGALSIDLRFDGFDGSVDRLFAADGSRVYWQAGNQLRAGVVVDGALSIGLRFDGFDGSVDRLFAAKGNRVYWQAGNQLRGGSIVEGALSIDLRFDGFDGSVDRLFAADGNQVYWQAGSQLRRGVVADGALSIDLRSQEFDGSVDRLFAVDGSRAYWQSGNELRRAEIEDAGSESGFFPENEIEVVPGFLTADLNSLWEEMLAGLSAAAPPVIKGRINGENAHLVKRILLERRQLMSLLDRLPTLLALGNIGTAAAAREFGQVLAFLGSVSIGPLSPRLDSVDAALHAAAVPFFDVRTRIVNGEEVESFFPATLPAYSGPLPDAVQTASILALSEFLSNEADQRFQLAWITAEAHVGLHQYGEAIKGFDELLPTLPSGSPRRKAVAVRAATTRLALGDQLFRQKRSPNGTLREEIGAQYAGAKALLATESVSRGNPRSQLVVAQATQQQARLQSGMNYVGLWDGFVPVQDFPTLASLASKQIEAATASAASFTTFLAQAEQEAEQTRDAQLQQGQERSNLTVLNDKLNNANLVKSKIDKQIEDIDAHASVLAQIEHALPSVGSAIMSGLLLPVGNTALGLVQGGAGLVGVAVNAIAQNEQLSQQRKLADIDRRISSNEIRIAALERDVSNRRVEFFAERLVHSATKRHNVDLLYLLVELNEKRAERELEAAVALAYLSERALAFSLGEREIQRIQFDYLDRAGGIEEAVKALAEDFAKLEDEIAQVQENSGSFQEHLSLRELYPVEFARFLQTGRMEFVYSLYQWSKLRPASHQARLHDVAVQLIGSQVGDSGFSGLLTHAGAFLVRDKLATLDPIVTRLIPTTDQLDRALAEQRDKGLSVIRVGGVQYYNINPATKELNIDTQLFEPVPPGNTRGLFEGHAPTGLWTLVLRDHTRLSIVDVKLHFLIVARESDPVLLEPKVNALLRAYEAELAEGDQLDRFANFSLRQSFPDAYAALEEGPGEIALNLEDFPAEDRNLQFKMLLVQAVDPRGKGLPGVGVEVQHFDPVFARARVTGPQGFSEDLDTALPALPRGERFPVTGKWQLRLSDPAQFVQLGDLRLFFLYSFEQL